jgi:AcrR family transcriptional regulator
MAVDKKTLLYDAVLNLIDKKRNVNSIKVSDIAEEANIGKGTIYEYFDSKEHLIAEAIAHMARERALSLKESIDEERSFEDNFISMLKNMQSGMDKNMTLFGHMSVNEATFSMQKAIQSALDSQFDEMRNARLNMLERLLKKGINEGVIKEMPPKYQMLIALNSATTCIFMYKKRVREFEGLDENDIFTLAYEVFVKVLK